MARLEKAPDEKVAVDPFAARELHVQPNLMKPHELKVKRFPPLGWWVVWSASFLACSQLSKVAGSDASRNAVEARDDNVVRPTFAAVPAGASPLSSTCRRDSMVTDLGKFKATFGVAPDDLAAIATGIHQTTLRWATLAPPDDNADLEEATIDLSYAGEARLFPECGNLAELDVQVSLKSKSGALDIVAPAVLTARTPELAHVTLELPIDALPSWTAALDPVLRLKPRGFQLDLAVVKDNVSGTFSVLGPQIEKCTLARFPASSHCEPYEEPISGTQLFRGIRSQDVIEGLSPIETTKRFFWDDNRVVTEAMVDFSSAGDEACVIPGAPSSEGSPTYAYSVPGQLRVYTADHRVDITVTARATTTGSDAKWTQIEISTVGPTLVSPSQAPAIDFVGLGQRSAAVTFASSREVTIANGDVVDLGALEVSAIDLKSPAVKPEGALCMVNGFLGGSSRLASGQYVAGNMPSRAP